MLFRLESQLAPISGGTESIGISLLGDNGHENVWSFEYDRFNRLTSTQNGGNISRYTYGGNGMRLSKEVTRNGVTTNTRHLWDGAHIVGDIVNGSTHTFHRGLGGQLISTVQNATATNRQTFHYMHNGMGDVIGLLNSAGQSVENYRFDAFGNQLGTDGNWLTHPQHPAGVNAIHNPFRYRGDGYFDGHTGFIYQRFRYLDTTIGRFINEDPYWHIGNMQRDIWAIRESTNLFVFGMNNPIMFIDPWGLNSIGEMGQPGPRYMLNSTGPLRVGDRVAYIGGDSIGEGANRMVQVVSSHNSGEPQWVPANYLGLLPAGVSRYMYLLGVSRADIDNMTITETHAYFAISMLQMGIGTVDSALAIFHLFDNNHWRDAERTLRNLNRWGIYRAGQAHLSFTVAPYGSTLFCEYQRWDERQIAEMNRNMGIFAPKFGGILDDIKLLQDLIKEIQKIQ